MTDSNERTLAMHAVRGGNVAILEIVLNSIDESKVWMYNRKFIPCLYRDP